MPIPPIQKIDRNEVIDWDKVTNDSLYKNVDGQYIDYVINNRYYRPHHKYMLPLTTPNGFRGKSVAFVQLAATTILWVADWTASRSTVPPEIPDPDFIFVLAKKTASAEPVRSEEWIILHEDLEAGNGAIIEDADGQTITYRISGTYYYGLANPTEHTHRHVSIGLPPYLEQSNTIIRRIPNSLLKPNIIEAPLVVQEV